MSAIKVIIVDDEMEAREGIAMLLEKDPEIEITALCKNGLEAIKAVQDYAPELIFLDIQMPAINGFEVLSTLSEKNLPEVIFVTAYDQYSLKAFENHAVDYLLKPFTNERFFKALAFAKKRIYTNRKSNASTNLDNLLNDYQQSEGKNNEQLLVKEQQNQKKIIKSQSGSEK